MIESNDKQKSDSLLTVIDVSKYLRISRKRVLRLCREGRITFVQIDNQVMFNEGAIDEFVERCKKEAGHTGIT